MYVGVVVFSGFTSFLVLVTTVSTAFLIVAFVADLESVFVIVLTLAATVSVQFLPFNLPTVQL